MEVKAKLSTLTRRLEELEMRNQHEVRTMAETLVPNNLCFIFQSTEHLGEHCPTVPSMRDMLAEQANTMGQYKPPTNAPYNSTYNPNWRNHPKLSWKPKPPPYVPLLHSNSMVPRLKHSHHHHHHHLQLRRL